MTQAAGVGLLGSLLAADGQPFAALRAAPFQHEAAILRTHPYQEAMRAVSRPIRWVEAFGGACAAGVAVALFSQAWPWLKQALALIDVSSLSFAQWTVLLAAALALLIAPVAMYFVLSDE